MGVELIWDFIKKFAPLLAITAACVAIFLSGDHHGRRIVQQEWDKQTARLAVAEANRLKDQAVRDADAERTLHMAATQIALLRDSIPDATFVCKRSSSPVPPRQPPAAGNSPAGTGPLPQTFELNTQSLKTDAAECDGYVELLRSVLKKWPR